MGPISEFPEIQINQELFCSIYVNSDLLRDEMASLVAELTGGQLVQRGVNCAWARITFDDNYGDIQVHKRDPGDFVGWPMLLEVMPPTTPIVVTSFKVWSR